MEINPVEVSWEGASRISGHSTFHSFARFLNPIDQLIRVESVLLFVKISLFGRQVGACTVSLARIHTLRIVCANQK